MTGTTGHEPPAHEHAGRVHAGQAARARHRILELWHHNRGPLSGAFSIIDAYLALFGDVIPDLDDRFGGCDFIPKATSANAVYAALEQTRHIRLDAADLPPLPTTGTAAVTYGPEKLGISLWNAVGRALHYQQLGIRRPVIVGVSDGELQCNIDAAARLAGAARLADLLVLLDANGLQSAHPIATVDPTLTPGPDRQRPLQQIWTGYRWWTAEVDGHDRAAVTAAIQQATSADRPALVILRTVKGRGLGPIEGKIGRYNHGVDPPTYTLLTQTLARHAAHHPDPPPPHPPPADPSTPATTRERPALRAVHTRIDPPDTVRTSQVLAAWLHAFHRNNPAITHIINTDTTHPFDPPLDPLLDPNSFAGPVTRCVGINEPGAFNLARGISQSGGFPIYISPAVHLEGCADEFRLAGLHRDPMLVIGYNAGSHLGHWGPAYLSSRDLEIHRAPGVEILQPATTGDLAALLAALPGDGPTYLRLPHRLLDHRSSEHLAGDTTTAVTDGVYRMPSPCLGPTAPGPTGPGPGEVVFLATGAAMPVALTAAHDLTRTGRPFTVLNLVRLTLPDPAVLAQHLRNAQCVCVLADGQTSALELLVNAARRNTPVVAIDLTQQHRRPQWWLRKPLDQTQVLELLDSQLARGEPAT